MCYVLVKINLLTNQAYNIMVFKNAIDVLRAINKLQSETHDEYTLYCWQDLPFVSRAD